jgi:16S rRNA (adenine1518-N6/adenine1519-N6)-dimethyltransferase
MNLASKRAVQNLLRKYQVRPSKKLGQNFLIDKRVIKKLIRAANLKPGDIILEIGPGIGTLTVELAKKVKKVIAIEKDQNLVRILANELRRMGIKNVKIIQADILKFPSYKSYKLLTTKCKIIGNLPFYLTAPVIRKFLEATEKKPYQMTFVVQKEVGQRICVKPPDMNLLAVSVQFYAKPEFVSFVSKKSFWPQPKVDSAILRITPLVGSFRKMTNTGLFFKIVRAGFSQPRKQLINNLTKGLKLNRGEVKNWLLKNNIQPNQRAETLAIEDWLSLTKSCKIR